jgi:hypothetical protein
MRSARFVHGLALVLAVIGLAAPATATTLVRQGLEGLTAENETVVYGKVLDTHSYWNADRSFILTDVRVRPTDRFKGKGAPMQDVTVTLLGGTVGETTVMVIGSPLLVPGSDYVLFLKHEDLPGATQRLTVRDLVQGVFEVAKGRAVSQAVGHPLLPDVAGRTEAPGGEQGFDLNELTTRIRDLAGDR